MDKPHIKRYSVYERATDRPVCIYRTAKECAAALGITRDSFYKLLWRQRHSKTPKKLEIFEDNFDEEVSDA